MLPTTNDKELTMFLPPATKLGRGYIFTGVCDSVHGGEYLGRYTPRDQVHPLDQVPPRTTYTPWDQVHPLGPGTPPWDQVHPPTRYTPQTRYTPRPGPGTPPGAVHAGRYGQQASGTHPTGMYSCCEGNPNMNKSILGYFCAD